MPKISPFHKRICVQCGTEFTPKSSHQKSCNEMKEVECPICHKMFLRMCSTAVTTQTCSIKCQAQLVKQKRQASASLLKKKCKYCGKEFTPKSVRDVYCYDKHYKTCVICGKSFEIDVRARQSTQTCSKDCFVKLQLSHRDLAAEHEKQKAVLLAKYGVDNSAKIPGAREKIVATTRERYGADWFTQTQEYKDKVKETNLKKYGYEHHMMSPEFINKRIQHLKESKGVENVFQLEETKEKAKQTNLAKFGVEYISQSPEIQDKIVATNMQKYGVRYAMQSEEIKEKAKQTNIRLYGRAAYTQQHIKDIDNWYAFMRDPRAYIDAHYESPPRSKELADDLGVDVSTVDLYLQKNDAKDCVSRAKSLMELDLIDYIHSLDPTIRVIHNDKTVIRPLELDLYLPDFNFAIECDPTCTHNSSFLDPWGQGITPRLYHQNKTQACDEAGVFLLHIFGYEWSYNREVILSMIANVLHKNTTKIYARTCEIKQVNSKEARSFLNQNHRQGNTNSQIRLGLYHDSQLVSLMTFGRFRATMGTGNEDLSDCWELSRFCSLKYTTVVGGAEKLFKYFIEHHHATHIRSFSDRAHTRGSIYSRLGFVELRRSDPSYVWVDVKTDKGYHRYSAQKRNLKAFLKDDSIDLSKTEKQIMEEHGFAQVYDSGTITWEWRSDI